MAKKKNLILGSAIGLGIVFTGMTWSVGRKIYKKTFGEKPRVLAEDMENHYSKHESKVLDRLEQYQNQKFLVESNKNGYLIETLHMKSHKESQDVIILVHGITSNYYELLPVAFRYLDDGFNVLLYNQRQTGLTGGKDYTFGLCEQYDLEEIATIARRLYPKGFVGVHGFSMGAATAAMHAKLNEKTKKVSLYLLDGVYHTMESTVELALKENKSLKLPKPYMKWSGNVVLKLLNRVKYEDVQPLAAIAHVSVPILLIHGIADKVTSPKGSQMMYDAIKHQDKELIFFDTGHCVAHRQKEPEYFKKVYDFIEKYTNSAH